MEQNLARKRALFGDLKGKRRTFLAFFWIKRRTLLAKIRLGFIPRLSSLFLLSIKCFLLFQRSAIARVKRVVSDRKPFLYKLEDLEGKGLKGFYYSSQFRPFDRKQEKDVKAILRLSKTFKKKKKRL